MSVDPDSELIVATAVSAANGGDAAAAEELLADDLRTPDGPPHSEQTKAEQSEPEPNDDDRSLSVYGDSAYGSGELVNRLEQAGAQANCKVQPPVSPGGRFSKDAFTIDLEGRHRQLPGREHHVAAAVRRGADREVRGGVRRLSAG